MGHLRRKHIAIFLAALKGGGAERASLDLAKAFLGLKCEVDIVLCRREGEFISQVPDGIRQITLGISPLFKVVHSLTRLPSETTRLLFPMLLRRLRRKIRSLPKLARYLRSEKPGVLLASTPFPNLLALWARSITNVNTRAFVKQDSSISAIGRKDDDPYRQRFPTFIKCWYPKADGIIAVSGGIAQELNDMVRIPKERIRVIYNPVDMERITALCEEAIDDPWFQPGEPPVILAVGRLIPQKDYPTLLKAFSLLRQRQSARLLIIGEGKERSRLESMVYDLGLTGSVRLPGFDPNPYAYMGRAGTFVLSSVSEGLATVLIEALACGTAIVSTDCPHGPAEILENGKYGKLVPPGNPDSLAQALCASLTNKQDSAQLRGRAENFNLSSIGQQYLTYLFPEQL